MTTGTTIVLVAGAGVAIWFVMRQQQQQQQLLAAAAAGGGAAAGAGGIGGLATRLVNQWKQDPLGIANAKAVIGGATDVLKNAGHEVSSLFGGIF